MNALKLLAILRQAKPDQETAAAYLLDLRAIPSDVLEQACQGLGRRPRGDHELAWPDVGTIRAVCESIMRRRREAEEQARPKLTDGDTPVDPAKWGEFRARVQALAKRKVMP